MEFTPIFPHNLENSLVLRAQGHFHNNVRNKRVCFLSSYLTGKTSREEEDSSESCSEVK